MLHILVALLGCTITVIVIINIMQLWAIPFPLGGFTSLLKKRIVDGLSPGIYKSLPWAQGSSCWVSLPAPA